MAKKNPCAACVESGADCRACPHNPKNSIPITLYAPKGAARVMLAGKILKGEKGMMNVRWDKNLSTFVYQKDGGDFFLTDFSGLYSEEA